MGGARPNSGVRGRGTDLNPRNRFESISFEKDTWTEDDPLPSTEFLRDHSRSIIAYNESPDVGFDASVNPYRGCEHGCIYCFARPNHEFLGFSAGLDFETRILVKQDAPDLLSCELVDPAWRPQTIAMSGVTDPYQPVERRLGLTRRCLEVLRDFRNPVVIITKNDLVTRDVDILGDMAGWDGSLVFVSVTSLEAELSRAMEPRATAPERRIRAIEKLSAAGVPVGVLAAPIVPGLTDHEIPAILERAADAGARFAGYIPLRLPYGVADLFEHWLETHVPEKKDKVMARVRAIRGGRPNDPRYRSRMRGTGPYAAQMKSLFELGCRRGKLNRDTPVLSVESFRRPEPLQKSLLF